MKKLTHMELYAAALPDEKIDTYGATCAAATPRQNLTHMCQTALRYKNDTYGAKNQNDTYASK
ncbi:MAG TPA: hypothetical protein PLG34_04545 [Spirochaetota bacterium]|nr:hypothetical protein [Spirochaetota bacterium]HPY87231.1 hypothetical protein [Spirochaetota bacterium]